MSTTHITPTIGRIVYYRGDDKQTRAAIVANVHSPFCLGLNVLPLSANDTQCGYMPSVTHADPAVEPGCLRSWDWMPYQKQQAEKHASEQTSGSAQSSQLTGSRANWAGTGLDFGTALMALKDGKRVARAGWNGKGMWLALTGKDGNWNGSIEGGAMPADWQGFLPFIGMYTADKHFVPWLASQTDVLAEDWQTV